jgi:hypothetical protein
LASGSLLTPGFFWLRLRLWTVGFFLSDELEDSRFELLWIPRRDDDVAVALPDIGDLVLQHLGSQAFFDA